MNDARQTLGRARRRLRRKMQPRNNCAVHLGSARAAEARSRRRRAVAAPSPQLRAHRAHATRARRTYCTLPPATRRPPPTALRAALRRYYLSIYIQGAVGSVGMEVHGESALQSQEQDQDKEPLPPTLGCGGVGPQAALATLDSEVRKLGGAVRVADVAVLRSWLRTQPHLPADLISDVDLVLAYWSCQCSMEVTKQLLDLHFTLRTHFTTFFRERCVDAAAEQAFRTVLMAPLRAATASGARGVYCQLLPPADPASFHFDQVIRAFMLMFDVWQQREGAWPSFAILIDMERVTLAHVARISLPSLRQVLYFLQEAMLVRLQEVHFLNAPSFMDKVLALLRPFMKRELQDMIRVHQPGATSLYDHVPLDAFPSEPQHELTERLVVGLREGWARAWLRMEERRRVREQLRPPTAPGRVRAAYLAADLCPQGSFKQLDLD